MRLFSLSLILCLTALPQDPDKAVRELNNQEIAQAVDSGLGDGPGTGDRGLLFSP